MSFRRVALLGAFMLASPSLAETPAALLVDAHGAFTPEISIFDELSAGTELRLDADTEITVAHYATCDEVTVRGGSVEIGTANLNLTRTSVISRVKTGCTEQVSLTETDTASGSVVMRNFGQLPKVPLSPDIVVAGAAAKGFETLAILRNDREIAKLAVSDGRIAWPEDALYLSDATKYVLVLSGASAMHRAVVVADRNSSGRVVLRP